MIGRPSCRPRLHPLKPQLVQVQFRNENINYANWIVVAYAIVPAPWRKWVLLTVLALYKARHPCIPPQSCRKDSKSAAVGGLGFSHSLGRKRSLASRSDVMRIFL